MTFSDYGLSKGTEWMRYGAPALITLALFFGAYGASADDGGPVMRAYLAYVSWLDRQFRLLFIFVPARRVVLAQVIVLYLLLTLQALIGIPYWYGLVPLCLLGPSIWVKDRRKKRLAQIEEQLDGFVLSLANALKSTPSVGSAFQSVVHVLQEPFSQEVDLAAKEMKVGSSLDQALLHMASRIGSRQVDSALSAILIGRQVGGNLPKVLETTAMALREMRRLEGVVRTKTAEAKTQLIVIALIPFVLCYAIDKISPGYFIPLTQSFLGYTIIAACVIGWIAAIALARNMLRVDI